MPRRGIDLTEDQWVIVKTHAASRRQTISEFFADVLADLGMDGHVRPATTMAAVDGFLKDQPPVPGGTTAVEDGQYVRQPPGGSFGVSRPAPKLTRKKRA